MNLLISSTINTSIGTTVSNAIGYITQHMDSTTTPISVPCDLQFYVSMAQSNLNKDNFTAVILKDDGTILNRIISTTITLTTEEAMAANLPLTIFTKVAQKLNTDYGWTVSVQA